MRGVTRALLVLTVFAIPWEYSLDLGAPFGYIARVLGLIAAVTAVPAILQTLQWKRLTTLHWLTAVLYLWFCCTYFWTRTPYATLIHLRWYAQEMMLVWLVWEFTDSAADLFRLMQAWLAGSWVLATLTLADFVMLTGQAGQERFVAAGQDPNDVARFLCFGFPVAALLLDQGGRRIWRLLAVCYFPIAFCCVLLTGSRSGLVVGLAALAGCGAWLLIRNPNRAVAGTIAVITAAALILAVVPEATKGRLNSVSDLWNRGDLNQRVNIWSAGWRAFKEAPAGGQGAGSFVDAAGLAPEDTAHNTALGVLVEGGLVAMLLASALVMASLSAVFRSPEPLRIALAVMMGIWVLSSMVGTIAENRTTWVLFGVAAVSERLGRGDPTESGPAFSVSDEARLYGR